MNGDSQAIPIQEIEAPMLRLLRRTWIVTPLAITMCASAASSPRYQAKSLLKVTEASPRGAPCTAASRRVAARQMRPCFEPPAAALAPRHQTIAQATARIVL